MSALPNGKSRHLIAVFCVLGAVVASLGVFASVARSTGQTPAFMFNRNATWASLQHIAGIPVEFGAVVCFLSLFLLIVLSRRRHPVGAMPLTFVIAAPTAGYYLHLWLRTGQRSWSAIAIAVLAALALVASVIPQDEWQTGTYRALVALASDCWHNASARATIAIFIFVAVGTAAGLQSLAAAVPAATAREQDLRRWYSAQRPVVAPELSRQDGVRIIIFTDYECPFCRQSVPASLEVISQEQKRGLSIDVVIRDYPLDSACNAYTRTLHPNACAAAIAVRMTRAQVGENSAATFANWLYDRGTILSNDLIATGLSRFGAVQTSVSRWQAQQGLAADIAFAHSIRVTGTPSYIVNGVLLPSGPEVLAWVLRYERERRANSHDRS